MMFVFNQLVKRDCPFFSSITRILHSAALYLLFSFEFVPFSVSEPFSFYLAFLALSLSSASFFSWTNASASASFCSISAILSIRSCPAWAETGLLWLNISAFERFVLQLRVHVI
jgi:hypothetical protein